MNLLEYQEEIKRTCPDLGRMDLNLAHMVLGMASEEEELCSAHSKHDKVGYGEELADRYWYIGNYANFRGYSLKDLHEECVDFVEEEWEKNYLTFSELQIPRLQDLVKKYLAYGKEIDRSAEKNCLLAIMYDSKNCLESADLNLSTILQNNIDKLKVRYPEKFTRDNALTRDLDKERKELEK